MGGRWGGSTRSSGGSSGRKDKLVGVRKEKLSE